MNQILLLLLKKLENIFFQVLSLSLVHARAPPQQPAAFILRVKQMRGGSEGGREGGMRVYPSYIATRFRTFGTFANDFKSRE